MSGKIIEIQDFKEKFSDDFISFQEKEKLFENLLATKSSIKQKSLKDYKDGFLNQFSVTFVASLAIKSGQLVLDTNNAYVNLGAHVISLLPFIGDKISLGIASLYEAIESVKIKAQADNITKYAADVTTFEKNIKCLMINIISNFKKQQEIFYEAEEVTAIWQTKLDDLCQKIKDFVIEN